MSTKTNKSQELKPGTVVRLRSGGPMMTVEQHPSGSNRITVIFWCESRNTYVRESLDVKTLVQVTLKQL